MPGFWEELIVNWPMRSLHVVHLKTGKILIFDTEDEQLWTPPAGPFVSVPVPNGTTDLMCAGHSALADGRLLVVGLQQFSLARARLGR